MKARVMVKLDGFARAVKLEVKKELKLQKKTEEKERYEVKDRGKENWEDFDVDWEE